MIYNFIFPLADDLGFLNIFRYITFRSGGALITAMIISFIFGPYLIKLLKSYQSKGQPIRTDGPEWQIKAKKGTPTMGGVLILLSIFFSTIIWADISNLYIWMVLFVTIGWAAVTYLAEVDEDPSRNITFDRADRCMHFKFIFFYERYT